MCSLFLHNIPERQQTQLIVRGLINKDVFLLLLSGVTSTELGRDWVGERVPSGRSFFS